VWSAGAAQPVAVQPILDRAPVHLQLPSDLRKRPCPPAHPVCQIGLQARKAELRGTDREALIGGAAALAGAADRPWGPVNAGLSEQASDDINAAAKLAGELWQTRVVLTARHQVAVQVGESEGVGAVVEASLLAVDDREAAIQNQTTACWCCWGCFPCAWGAGSPTTPGDPPSSGPSV
jgi:hypothetical protein